MSFEPFSWATFCDDVRQEVGNKLSYLGVYGPTLIVPSFPTTLLKLCCAFSVRVSADSPPKHVVFKLLRDEETLLQHDVDVPDPEAANASADGNAVRMLTIGTIAQLVSFPVTQHCFLAARAYIDGKELRGGSLELVAAGARGDDVFDAYVVQQRPGEPRDSLSKVKKRVQSAPKRRVRGRVSG